jgi:hypothetical protein
MSIYILSSYFRAQPSKSVKKTWDGLLAQRNADGYKWGKNEHGFASLDANKLTVVRGDVCLLRFPHG